MQWRTYRLCTMLRCPPSALDDEAAADLDWLLLIDDEVAKARSEKLEEASSR